MQSISSPALTKQGNEHDLNRPLSSNLNNNTNPNLNPAAIKKSRFSIVSDTHPTGQPTNTSAKQDMPPSPSLTKKSRFIRSKVESAPPSDQLKKSTSNTSLSEIPPQPPNPQLPTLPSSKQAPAPHPSPIHSLDQKPAILPKTAPNLGKLFYFLEQMKTEVVSSDKVLKDLQMECKFLRDKNKELEKR